MKKIISFVLVLAALASLFVMPVSAATDRALAQKAITETAFAYYYKEHYVQYDSTTLTYQAKRQAGASRMTAGAAPEMAAADFTVYTVCSDFCSDVYYNTFGYWINGSPRTCNTANMVAIPATNPEVVVKCESKTAADRAAAVQKIRDNIQVGDVLVHNGGDGGHAMLYIGDALGDGTKYLIHSGGKKINIDSGVDQYEDYQDVTGHVGGSIRLDNVEIALDAASTNYNNLHDPDVGTFSLLRFMDAADISKDITPVSLCRTKWPGLEIDRSGDRPVYHNVLSGEEMTVTVTIKNNGKTAYKALPISEAAPKGASIVEGSANEGGKISADGIQWTIDVPAGAEKKLSYKVKITAKTGETVTMPAGMVDAIPSRELTFKVGASRVAKDAFADVIKAGTVAGITNAKTQIGFANEVYKTVLGKETGLPDTMKELLEGLFTTKSGLEDAPLVGGTMIVRKTEFAGNFKTINEMIVPKHVMGRAFLYENSDPLNYGAWDRNLDPKAEHLEPGDIIVGMRGRNVLSVENPNAVYVYVYLGEGQILARGHSGRPVVTSFESVAGSKMHRQNLCFVLRPSLVG